MRKPLRRTLGIVALASLLLLGLLDSICPSHCASNCDSVTFFTTKTSASSEGGYFVVVDPDNINLNASCSKTWRTDHHYQVEDGDTVNRKKRPVICQSGWYVICYAVKDAQGNPLYDGKLGCTMKEYGAGNAQDLDGCRNCILSPP